jgi:hypothetical protein
MALIPKFPDINQRVENLLQSVKQKKERRHELFPKLIENKKIKYSSKIMIFFVGLCLINQNNLKEEIILF